jgi:hypothetical protein
LPLSHEDGCRLLAELHADMAGRRMDAIDNLTTIGLRGLMIINGGALIALFTIIGHDANQDLVKHLRLTEILHAALWFVSGLVAVLLATLVGFVGQQFAARGEVIGVQDFIAEAITGKSPARATLWPFANGLIVVAALLAAGSVGAFARGCWIAIVAATGLH